MTRCAETGRVPPASGVIVNAVELPAGFRTVRIELITVVVTIAMPTICEAPVALLTTVGSVSRFQFMFMYLALGIIERYTENKNMEV